MEAFQDKSTHKALEQLFQGYVSDKRWKERLAWYSKEVDALGNDYLKDITEGLHKYGKEAISRLHLYLENVSLDGNEKNAIISTFRKVFAEISLDKLQPDLVIMDEFQRFRNLITKSDDEQTLLSDRFFADKNTKVLLLSATPYKPFTTLDELAESGTDEHFSDFRLVIDFLQEDNADQKVIFDEAWKHYNIALTHITANISGEQFDVVRIAKKEAEEALYGLMCRTERFNTGGVRTIRPKPEEMPLTPEDIKAYFQARTLLDDLNSRVTKSGFRTVPMDYVKSSPYLLSFMDRYKLKEFVRDNRSRVGRRGWDLLYLPLKKIDAYSDIPLANIKLHYLYESLFKDYHAEQLLWVPASHPYYVTKGVFAKNAGFSKTLLFSSWEMVPRMVSCMISYSAERLIMKGLWALGRRPGKYYKAEQQSKTRYGAGRLAKFKDGENPLLYVSKYLADLYKPEEYLGMNIETIRSELTRVISDRVNELSQQYDIPIMGKKAAITNLTDVMRLLDGEELDFMPEVFREDTVENLVSAAIASPAICGYRLGCGEELALQIAGFFEKLFNRPDPALVVDLVSGKGADNYLEAILEYCVEGNLQAVLDEYDHMLEHSPKRWIEVLTEGPIDVNTYRVDMQDSDNKVVSRTMRTHIAIPFTNARMEDKAVMHTANIRNAFNSPFRPFVLSTTSIGQEGLDFHWYARKLLHWNLPSNPVDMEQREGRINRYECLSIRQRLGGYYKDVPRWDDIFMKAREEFKREDSDIVPYWCLPPDFPDQTKLVERIILEYPLSVDQRRYERLIKVLSLYRLTMGQPRQEELLEMLFSSGLSDEEIKELMINLSPFSRE